MRSARRCFRPGSRSCWKWSRTSASIGCAWPKAPCARGCCTTSWAASPMRMRACAACAPWKSAITSTTLQADRVEATAVALLEQVESEWGLEDPLAESVLRWAARLHETGLDIAHSKYHRHSAYLLEHADMPGFPARGAAAAVGVGRRSSAAAVLRVARGSAAAVGSSCGVPDRAAAPGGAAASGTQPAAAAGGASDASRAAP